MRLRSTLATEVVTRQDHFDPLDEFGRAGALRQAICEQTTRMCLEHFGSSLDAIVLTGSLARDEATFVKEERGQRLLGDAEFLLIFHVHTPLPSKVALSFLRQNIEGSLVRLGIVGEVQLSAAHADYLRKLRPHIFAYELRNWGQVVSGDLRILARVPNFPASDIPLEDGWRLLCNRMIEQLEALDGLEQRPKILPSRLFYRTVKLYLDMATSFLLFAGEYGPSYSERARRLRVLTEGHSSDDEYPFDLRRFCERVSECTRWKLLAPGLHNSSSFASENDHGFSWWEEAITYAQLLWRWELAHLTGTKGEASNEELLEKWMRSQPASRRLRGWLYVLRDQGWLRSRRNWPRWTRLVRVASPRDLIYSTASELFFELPCLLKSSTDRRRPDTNWDGLRSRLPVLPESEPGQYMADWQGLAADVAWNYHQFLVGTRS